MLHGKVMRDGSTPKEQQQLKSRPCRILPVYVLGFLRNNVRQFSIENQSQ